MKARAVIPSAPSVLREGLLVVAGAIVAALIIGQLPGVRAWIKAQWQDTPQGL